jgi:choline-sulfatase
LLDVMPTLLDIASDGAEIDYVAPIDGSSVAGALGAAADTGKNTTFAEYTSEGCTSPLLMIRKRDYKLTFSVDDPPILIDLAGDPDELRNIAADPNYKETLADLQRLAAKTWNIETLNERVLVGQRKHMFLRDALGRGAPYSWDFAPRSDAAKVYVRDKPGQDKRRARLPKLTH